MEDQNSTMVRHHTAILLLALSALVYEYNKTFRFGTSDDFKSFYEDLVVDKLKISKNRKELLQLLFTYSPLGQVPEFIDEKATTNMQGGIAVSGTNKSISVVFRGTDAAWDWVRNFMVFKRDLPGSGGVGGPDKEPIRVHAGFYSQLFTASRDEGNYSPYERLLHCLQDLMKLYPDYMIYVTGHSLGGALATLFGFLISTEAFLETKRKLVVVVSFGSPRVGDAAWKRAFDAQPNLVHYRITNGRDPIPATPSFGFHHVGVAVVLEKNSYEIFRGYDYSCFRFSLPFNLWPFDHYTDNMYRRLKANNWSDEHENPMHNTSKL